MPISKHDKQALADLFIHMGVPLVVAMQTIESWSGGETEALPQRAEKLSKLLAVSVEFATNITKKLEIRDAYTLENVRGKVIRIVTPIIAEQYVTAGEAPSIDSLKDLTDLFDVLLSFSDSVSPTDEKGSKPTKIANMIEACEPVLSAIHDDDKGIEREKAFQECVSGLKTRAEQLAPTLGLEDAIDSGLFRSIVSIFVTCYKNGSTIDDIWSSCDERLALINGLTKFVAEKAGIKTDNAKPQVTKKTPATQSTPKEESKPGTTEKKSDESDKGDDDGDFNHMSFFASGS